MRNVPLSAGRLTMFMCSPSSRQRAVMAAPSSGELCLVSRSSTISRPCISPRPRTSPTTEWRSCSSSRALCRISPLAVDARADAVLEHVEHGVADGGHERIVEVGGEEEVVALVGARLDLVGRDDRGQRQPGAEGLGHRDDVGHDAVAGEAVAVTGAVQGGLGLVEDQQHPARVAVLAQAGEVARGRDEDAAAGQDRLDDAGRERTRGLGVDELEAEVELAAPVELTVGGRDVGAVRVRRRQHEVARPGRAVALAAGAVGRAGGAERHPVPGAGEGDDLVAAGDQLREPQRRFVGLRARREQLHLVQRVRQAFREAPREVDDRAREHAAEQMDQGAGGLTDGGRDRRVRVAEDRAHLPGGEVDQLAPVARVEQAALGPLDEGRHPRRGGPDDMTVDVGPERRVQPGLGKHAHATEGNPRDREGPATFSALAVQLR